MMVANYDNQLVRVCPRGHGLEFVGVQIMIASLGGIAYPVVKYPMGGILALPPPQLVKLVAEHPSDERLWNLRPVTR